MGDTQVMNKVCYYTFPRRASHALRPVLVRLKDPEKKIAPVLQVSLHKR